MGNAAVVSWGFGICPYIELGTERLFFISALDQWLNKRTSVFHPALSEGGHSLGAGSHHSTRVH